MVNTLCKFSALLLYEVEIIPIPLIEFTGLEITGEKDAIQAAGNKVTFSYRDAYFDLQKAQVIV
jgi:hypothetical protein